jgi:hypothetical protein
MYTHGVSSNENFGVATLEAFYLRFFREAFFEGKRDEAEHLRLGI